MPQEYIIEVSDKLNSWTSEGRRYRPGIYRTDDLSLVQSAERTVFGVTVTKAKTKADEESQDAGEGAATQEVKFPQDVETTEGPLSIRDLRQGNEVTYPCRRKICVELAPFKSKEALQGHNREIHPRRE